MDNILFKEDNLPQQASQNQINNHEYFLQLTIDELRLQNADSKFKFEQQQLQNQQLIEQNKIQ